MRRSTGPDLKARHPQQRRIPVQLAPFLKRNNFVIFLIIIDISNNFNLYFRNMLPLPIE